MSNTTEKLAIANIALFNLGHKTISAIDDTTPMGEKIGDVIEPIIKELLTDDWYFNRKRVPIDDMTQVHKLTVDTAPSASAWSVGATITGATSAETCEVVGVISDTVYLVTEPSGDFTDGEELSDGTNSVDCATGYPDVDDDIDIDQYQYGMKKPSDCLLIRGIFHIYNDKVRLPHKTEGNVIYTVYNDNYYFQYNYYIQESSGVADVTQMPLWFHRLISAKIAFMLSANITENQKIRSKAELDYNDAYLEAKEKNGSEEGAIDYSGNNDWAEGANRMMEDMNYF